MNAFTLGISREDLDTVLQLIETGLMYTSRTLDHFEIEPDDLSYVITVYYEDDHVMPAPTVDTTVVDTK
jgi:hypothetical protein